MKTIILIIYVILGLQYQMTAQDLSNSTAETVVAGHDFSATESMNQHSTSTSRSTLFNNSLPIELKTEVCGQNVCLSWSTGKDTKIDYFTIVRSKNGMLWEEVIKIKGVTSTLNYTAIDSNPYTNASYYHIEKTDLDGTTICSKIKMVELEINEDIITIYPNPSTDQIIIRGSATEIDFFRIYNALGKDVTTDVSITFKNESRLQVDISVLTRGNYVVSTKTLFKNIFKQ